MALDPGRDGHVLYRGFGLPVGDEEPMNDVALEISKRRRAALDSTTLQLVLREYYETEYGICDHDSPASGMLSLVTLHQKERVLPYGRFDYLARMFVLYEIKDTYGFNLAEFLDRPRHEVDHLMTLSMERKPHRDKLSRGLEQQLREVSKQSF